MKIGWYSPLDPSVSEIARYSEQLLPYLRQLAEVLTVEDGTDGTAPVMQMADAGVAILPVYHIGNNPLHLPIYQRSLQEPGLVVLHDLSLVDLARHLSHQLERPELWKDMMCRQYGDEVRALVNRSEKSVADYNEMVANYPLFQPFVAGALGVLVHSRYALDALQRQLAPGTPVLRLNLPAPPPDERLAPVATSEPLRFVFCGHVGPNRRLVEFLQAWGSLPSPQRITLELYGNISSSRQLLQHAGQFGVEQFIRINGYVSDAELEQALQSADFAINLRWPTMGEASASQLRYWTAALPTLVSDVGWYAELPADSVCRISVGNEAGDLRALLEDALASRDKYRQVGLQGQARLRRAHNPEYYARELLAFAARLSDGRLACRTLERELVPVVASMCEKETDTRLFRDALETAVATFLPEQA
jgi:glycosyltransferase involved in cell wall biosynthesis